jgi:phosphoribosylanthranilate isomerase
MISSGRLWSDETEDTKIKICGVISIEFALDCYYLGIGALGFHILQREILSDGLDGKLEMFSGMIDVLPPNRSCVLVTDIVDSETLKHLINHCTFDTVQLHRYIPPDQMNGLVAMSKDIQYAMKVIGVVAMSSKVSEAEPVDLALKYSNMRCYST